MTSFLVTGGAGFIGSHLVNMLLDAGHEVAVIDDLSTGAIRNLDRCRGNPALQVHVAPVDVRHSSLVAELVDRADVVVHLAAAVGVELVVRHPVHTIETNVGGTEVVLTHAAKKRRKVIVASTSEVYGKSVALPFREDHDLVIGPTTHYRWSYACSKALDEFLALAYFKERGVPVVIARFFNTVGPRQSGRYGMVIPRFVRQALAGGPLTVYGDGNQTRCFCHVDDVVRALVLLAGEPRAIGEVVNLGATEEISIGALAERIAARAGRPVAIEHVPYDRAYEAGFEDMQRRVPDIGKAAALLGWRPERTLDDILDDVFAWERAAGGVSAED